MSLPLISSKSNTLIPENITAVLHTDKNDECMIVAAVGTRDSGVSSLLNHVFGTGFEIENIRGKAATLGVQSHRGNIGEGSRFCIMDVEGFDSRDRRRDLTQGKYVALVLSMADVLLFNVRYAELIRADCSGIDRFMKGVEKNLELQGQGMSVTATRRPMIVSVRDYEQDQVGASELEKATLELFSASYSRIIKPNGFVGTDFSDVFDVSFVLLPHFKLCADKFNIKCGVLRGLIVEQSKSQNYTQVHDQTAEQVSRHAVKVWDILQTKSSGDMPSEREVQASYACDKIMEKVYEEHKSRTGQWRTMIDRGRIIRKFGIEVQTKIDEALQMFDRDASAYQTTKAFTRKKDDLRELALGDAYVLYSQQLGKLRETVYDLFRNKLARTRISGKVEKQVNIAIKDCEKYFCEQAQSLRCKASSWRYDHARQALVDRMREGATERLQLARIHGNYVPPIRTPVAVAFHTLLPSPFGQDSRAPRPVREDYPKPDKNRLLRPGRTRFRPHQVGPTVHPGKAYNLDDINEFDYIFEDMEKKQ